MIIGAIDPLVIPIVGILMPLLLVPTILVLKYRQARREWEHLERMKAMEQRAAGGGVLDLLRRRGHRRRRAHRVGPRGA